MTSDFEWNPLQSCHGKPIQATFHVEFFFLRGESLYIRTDEAPPPGASSRPLSAPHLPIVSTNISDGRSWLWDGSWRFFQHLWVALPWRTETNRLISQSDWDNLTRKTPGEQQQPQIIHHKFQKTLRCQKSICSVRQLLALLQRNSSLVVPQKCANHVQFKIPQREFSWNLWRSWSSWVAWNHGTQKMNYKPEYFFIFSVTLVKYSWPGQSAARSQVNRYGD